MTDHKTPELHDRLHEDIEKQHRQEQRRKEETLRWLEEHTGFKPFGVEW